MAGRYTFDKIVATKFNAVINPVRSCRGKLYPMPSDAFLIQGGKELGPFSPAQLKQLAAAGKIDPNDLIKKGPDGQPVPARAIAGLVDDLKAAADKRELRPTSHFTRSARRLTYVAAVCLCFALLYFWRSHWSATKTPRDGTASQTPPASGSLSPLEAGRTGVNNLNEWTRQFQLQQSRRRILEQERKAQDRMKIQQEAAQLEEKRLSNVRIVASHFAAEKDAKKRVSWQRAGDKLSKIPVNLHDVHLSAHVDWGRATLELHDRGADGKLYDNVFLDKVLTFQKKHDWMSLMKVMNPKNRDLDERGPTDGQIRTAEDILYNARFSLLLRTDKRGLIEEGSESEESRPRNRTDWQDVKWRDGLWLIAFPVFRPRHPGEHEELPPATSGGVLPLYYDNHWREEPGVGYWHEWCPSFRYSFIVRGGTELRGRIGQKSAELSAKNGVDAALQKLQGKWHGREISDDIYMQEEQKIQDRVREEMRLWVSEL